MTNGQVNTETKSTRRLRPRNGNITILGKEVFQKQMNAFGKVLADRLGKILNIPVSFVLLDMNNEQKRLCLTICGPNLENVKENLIPNFDVFHNKDAKKECLRIWGIPIDFIAPKAEQIKKSWKELFDFTARIGMKGDLELLVSTKDNDWEILEEFRKELEKDFPEIVIRNKQRPRKGNARPGFVISFSVTAIRKETKERDALQNESPTTSPLKKEGKEEGSQRKTHTSPKKTEESLIPVEDVLCFCLANLTPEGRIELLKKLLPEGVGLYDTKTPLSLDDEGRVAVRSF